MPIRLASIRPPLESMLRHEMLVAMPITASILLLPLTVVLAWHLLAYIYAPTGPRFQTCRDGSTDCFHGFGTTFG